MIRTKNFLLITLLSFLFFNLFGAVVNAGSTNKNNLEPPPSTIKLKVKAPENFDDALKRVADYLILNMILPPVIDRENIKTQLYGKFKNDINDYINKNKINLDELSKIVQVKLNEKKEKLETIKDAVYKKLTKVEASEKPLSKQDKPKKKKEESATGYYIALVLVLLILAGAIFVTKNKKV